MTVRPGDVPAVALNDGTSIPQVGFGTWQVPQEISAQATLDALATGYRHVDTAAVYANEEGVGDAIRRSGLSRDDIYLTTKLWNPDQGYDSAMRAIDTSLAKLGVDQVDMYLIHWQCPDFGKYTQTWRALVEMRDSGRARSIGVSNFEATALRDIIDATGVVPALNQIELHPWLPQAQLRALHAELGIATESWSPLASGGLIGDPVLSRIGDKHGKTTAQVMVRWHLQLGLIVLPKSITPSRIAENIDVFDFALDDDDMAAIAALESGHRTGPHPDEYHELGW